MKRGDAMNMMWSNEYIKELNTTGGEHEDQQNDTIHHNPSYGDRDIHADSAIRRSDQTGNTNDSVYHFPTRFYSFTSRYTDEPLY